MMQIDYEMLKGHLWEAWDTLETDQKRKIPPPPVQKPAPESAILHDLTDIESISAGDLPVREAIRRRRSQRAYTGDGLTLEEISFLLWATQGVASLIRDGSAILRTVPSAGARHPFETYLLVNHVKTIEPGLYRYLGIEHKLCHLTSDPHLREKIHEACYEQYVLDSAVVFMWTAIPYRTEWRYGPLAPKLIAQDSGHMCQNLYLACESIGVGMCAVGAFRQQQMDAILDVDGVHEFAIYLATVGRIA